VCSPVKLKSRIHLATMWLLKLLTIAGLLLNLVLHVLTFFNCNPQDWIQPEWLAWLLVLGPFLAIALATLFVAERREQHARQHGLTFDNNEPGWMKPVIWLAAFYLIFNFFNYSVIDMRRYGGSPERIADGTYAVDPGHGRSATPITKQQYDLLRRREVRGGTGVIVVFYLQMLFTLFESPGRPRPRVWIFRIVTTTSARRL
jgi:hypothetical protein